jgi:hypothetical protein
MHQVGAFFVTRAKRGMDARRVYSAPTDRNSGVICDQTIALNGFYPAFPRWGCNNAADSKRFCYTYQVIRADDVRPK